MHVNVFTCCKQGRKKLLLVLDLQHPWYLLRFSPVNKVSVLHLSKSVEWLCIILFNFHIVSLVTENNLMKVAVLAGKYTCNTPPSR